VTRRKHLHVRDRPHVVHRRVTGVARRTDLPYFVRPFTARFDPGRCVGPFPHTHLCPTRGGPEPACRPSSGGRYAAGMSEYSLDGLVNQFAVVLTAMTETESLLRDRVRTVRLGTQSQPRVAEVAPSAPAPFPTGSVMPETAPALHGTAQTARGDETAPARMSAPAPATRPESSHTEPASPVTSHRNYDYFSELDEKLTGLRRRYLE
jgi:hypothetical protein